MEEHMRKAIKGFLSLTLMTALVVTSLTGCGDKKDSTDTSDKKDTTQVEDTKGEEAASQGAGLPQDEMVAAMGAGWNLGNQLEAVVDGLPGETNWNNGVITEDTIKMVKEAGFSSIRVPVSYFNYIGEGPDYTIDAGWLDRVQEVVDYCINNDMYTIINMHGDGYNSMSGWFLCNGDDQETIKAKYEAVWKQIAERFKDYDDHLIFESMNEEFDGNYNDPDPEYYDNINDYNQIFVDTVRQAGGNNAYRWLLIAGWNTDINYTAGDYGFKLPTDEHLSEKVEGGQKRIMVSVHYYAPWDFCGGESDDITQWGVDAEKASKTSSAAGQNAMAASFKLLYDKFTSQGYPVVIGEYGAIDKTEADPDSTFYRAYFCRKVVENSAKYGCIPVYWDNGWNGNYGFALFDRETHEVTQQEIINAIVGVEEEDPEAANVTAISLNETSLSMTMSENVQLTATLEGSDKAVVKWASSDETVATVNSQGQVKAQAEGNTVITATVGEQKAECSVEVAKSNNLTLGLYAIETKNWSTIASEETVQVTDEGGTFTLTLKGSEDLLSMIGSLYLKDALVQSETESLSLFTSAKIQLDSFTFNGKKCKILSGQDEAVNNGVFDYFILNQWVDGGSRITNTKLNDSSSYEFKGKYQEENVLEVTFTISDIQR